MGANVKLVDFSLVLDLPNISRHVAKVRTAKIAQKRCLRPRSGKGLYVIKLL